MLNMLGQGLVGFMINVPIPHYVKAYMLVFALNYDVFNTCKPVKSTAFFLSCFLHYME